MTARWWVLSDDALLQMLDRAREGEEPWVLLAELYANSDTEHVEGEP